MNKEWNKWSIVMVKDSLCYAVHIFRSYYFFCQGFALFFNIYHTKMKFANNGTLAHTNNADLIVPRIFHCWRTKKKYEKLNELPSGLLSGQLKRVFLGLA